MQKLDNYIAVGLVEGLVTSRNADEVLAAWQYLVDTGLVWRLQGQFGRQAQRLIDAGVITDGSDDNDQETL